MASVFDVARYILHAKGRMSAWKLQKLCYYAQAWSLAWTEAPLFDEDFEAWSNGPVCRALFNEYRGAFMVSEGDIPRGDAANLTADERDTVDVIIRDYGDMPPFELRELSHSEAPWRDARNGLPDGASSHTLIDKTAMGSYYGGL